MAVFVSKIDIRNFRSIRSLSLSPNQLAILVGKNDSGKSNVLRALNLFFNSETDPGDHLRFDIDHNIFNRPSRRAKQISIRLEIELPETYHDTNGNFIVWEKHWRTGGLVYNAYSGRRRVEGRRGALRVMHVNIPDKSNVHALLRNIHYVYVPAIKDLTYFSRLRAGIYDVIAEVSARSFRESSQDFEHSIAAQVDDLMREIEHSLGLHSRLALPRDLSHIFESLDFLSEGQNISLDARGDGIKARHIPLILKFMADKRRSLQVRGGPPHSFIWGYEEPENNLEISRCVEAADQFSGFLSDGIGQIILTTHSPVFYNLGSRSQGGKSRITCHQIFRDVDEDGTKESRAATDLDERMGTMTLLAPLVEELERRVRDRVQNRLRAQELAQQARRKIFVEGRSDQLILNRALAVFAPARAEELDVETLEDGAGVNYVLDMLLAWSAVAKHQGDARKAVGLVDLDQEGKVAASDWNGTANNTRYAKCITLKTPRHIIPALSRNFRVPVVLETLYDRQAWDWAEERGYLVDRDPIGVIPAELNQQIVRAETTLNEHLEEDWDIYVKRQFRQSEKRRMAQYFANMQDGEFRQRLGSVLVNAESTA